MPFGFSPSLILLPALNATASAKATALEKASSYVC